MKKIKKFLVIGLLAFIVLFPESSSAYKTTEQTALRINDNTILYTISYRFNFLNRDIYMPIVAKREVDSSVSSQYLNYQIFNGEEIFTDGDVSALVLSRSKIYNNYYLSPAGVATDFMFFAILTLPQEVVDKGGDFSLRVSNLPIKTDVTKENQEESSVGQVDLTEYLTPRIKI